MSLAVETQVWSETERQTPGAVSLTVPQGLRLLVSQDDFEILCRFNRDLRLERNAHGELIAMSPAGSKSGTRNSELNRQLANWGMIHRTGLVFDSSAGFTFPNGAVRAPDAAWIKLERWNAISPDQQERFAPIVPDFVVELCSPSDSRQETRAKMAEYLEQGVRLGWLIDPRTEEVEIYRRGKPVEILLKPRNLSGEDNLPGFILELSDILFDF